MYCYFFYFIGFHLAAFVFELVLIYNGNKYVGISCQIQSMLCYVQLGNYLCFTLLQITIQPLSSEISYIIIPIFHDPIEEVLLKIFKKRNKCCLPAFFPLPTMFSTSLNREIIISATLKLSSANSLNFLPV